MKYIIQPGIRIEKHENTTIDVLTPEQIKNYQKEGFICKKRIYQLISGRKQYEIVCTEIWQEEDIEHTLIIPEFLVPHRTYPSYVYAFAINLYSTNPEMSQRRVAEETRIKYDLQTFAHTTLGRAMKALEKGLMKITPVDTNTVGDERIMEQNKSKQVNKPAAHIIKACRFPSVQDTNARRKIIKSVIFERFKNDYMQKFKEPYDIIHLLVCLFLPIISGTAPMTCSKLFSVIRST